MLFPRKEFGLCNLLTQNKNNKLKKNKTKMAHKINHTNTRVISCLYGEKGCCLFVLCFRTKGEKWRGSLFALLIKKPSFSILPSWESHSALRFPSAIIYSKQCCLCTAANAWTSSPRRRWLPKFKFTRHLFMAGESEDKDDRFSLT